MTVLYPSARVKLAIRFEEGSDTALLDARAAAPATSAATAVPPLADAAAQLDSIQASMTGLAEYRDAIPPDEFDALMADLRAQRDAIQAQLAQAPGDPPEAIDGAPPDNRVVVGTILPRSVSIERNGLLQADTCTVEINHTDAPFDPRRIRSVGIEVVLGVVTPREYEEGIGGARRDDGSLTSLVAREDVGGFAAGTRFVGVVDDWTVAFNGEDGDVITLECRDMTALFLDQPLPSGAGIDLTLPLDQGISSFLDNFPGLRGTTVEFGVQGERAPIPVQAVPPTRPTRQGRARRARRGGNSKSVWDHVSELAASLGFVATFQDYTLRIIRPRTYYASRTRAARMVFGLNLMELQFSRKLSGVKVPTIEIRAYDPGLGRTRWARYPAPVGQRSGVFGITPPPRPSRANEVPPSGAGVEDKIQVLTVQGITLPSALERVAESVFTQIGRQEIEGNLTTVDLTSVDSDVELDLLGLVAGDSIELLMQGPPNQSDQPTLTAAILESLSVGARTRYLEQLGWAPDVARRFAELQQATAFQTTFRVQNAVFDWDQESGLEVKIDFQSYLVVREEQEGQFGLTEPPSLETAAAAADPTTATATAARDASSARRGLARDRQLGRITDQEYQERVAELLETEREAVRLLQSG